MLKACLFIVAIGLLPVKLFSQSPKIVAPGADAQIAFGIEKIKEAAKEQSLKSFLGVTIICDSAEAKQLIKTNSWKPVKSYGDQSYSVRILNKGKQKSIYILTGEATGAMYGALDVAEAIRCNTIGQFRG
jgi:hypothetical protein